MLFGTAKRNITPQIPVRLAGYASRTECFQSVAEDIYLRVHVQRTVEAQVVFIYGDLIWWNARFVDMARVRLQKELGLAAETVCFVASHNHSGPGTGNTFIPQLEQENEAYREFLLNEIVAAVSAALENLDEVTVWRFEGSSSLNVFRRLKVGGKIEMRPNFQVESDKKLTLLGFMGIDGEMKGIVVHYACHANVSGENTVQPDYPGITLKLLDKAYPNSVSMFWQGCTGDLRPLSVLGSHFASGDYEKCKEFAQDFFDDCQRALAQSGTRISEQISMGSEEILLPLDNRKSEEELQEILQSHDETWRNWALKVMEKGNPEAEKLRIKYVRYGKEMIVYFLGAELSQEYAAYVRSLVPAGLCTAYADGMLGYVCTEEQIKEGGYEPCSSPRYFALGGTISPSAEKLIKSKMKEMAENGTR